MAVRPRRVLGYARVSSAEQALGSSLRDQQDAIAAYAKARGLTVTKFYVEAESAIHEKIERREQIRALVDDARSGDLVVCALLDRWSRDPEFTYASVRRLRERGVSLYFVSDQCDPSTPEGDTMLGFRVLFAREEHKRIKQRMVGTRNLLRDRGYYVAGSPPLGYRRAMPKGHKGAEKNVLVVVPDEADAVRRIFARYLGGASMRKIAAELGLKIDRVKDAVHNRTYLGEQKNSRGEWIKGRHEAIVDAATFARVQATIAKRTLGGPRPRETVSETSDWILRDVATCGACGAKMSAAYAGPKDARRYYYACSKRCRAKGPRVTNRTFVPVRPVEDAVGPMVVARLAELREHIASAGDAPKPAPKVMTGIADKRAKLERRREKYLEAFADELMTREELRARLAKLDAERTRLDAEEIAETKPSALADARVRREMLRNVKTLAHAWKRATPAERRDIVNTLAESVAVKNGTEPRPTWKSVEDLARAG